MEDYPFDEENFFRFKRHALMGVSVLFITLIRLAYKYKNKDRFPEEIQYYSPMHKKLVNGIHLLMYIILILAPIIGFITIYQTGAMGYDFGGPFPENPEFNPVLVTLHKTLVITLGVLIIMHIGGVFMYKLKTGENLIKRMV
jgi:cytochrome b561